MAFKNFISEHKILTVIVSVILVILLSTTGTILYFLNKINITYDGTPPQTAPTISTAPAEEGTTNADDDDHEIDSIGKISKKNKDVLKDADDDIRANLDDSKKWYSEQVMNIALLGIDNGSKRFPYGRSDSMIIVSINKAVNKVKLISLSRTAYAAIPGYPNTRLSHAHGYGGAPLAIQSIEQNYKIKIDNYISCNFESFKKIIDAFGGVDITLTKAESKAMKQYNSGFSGAGTYTLDGDLALKYARLRKIDTDRDRTGRQRKVLLSIADKCKNITPAQAISLLNQVLPLVTTDLTRAEIVYQLASALNYLKWDISQYLVPAKPYQLVLRDGFEVIIMNWAHEVDYIHELIYEGVIPLYEE